MARVVNRWLMLALLNPWSGLGDDYPAERFQGAERDEGRLRALIRSDLGIEFATWRPELRTKAKDSLAYGLLFERDRLGDAFESVLPPIPATDPPSLVWQLIWDELFGGDVGPAEPEDFQVVDSPSEANHLT
jgi:hypothetical protein